MKKMEDPADILFICSLGDLNCLHDYLVAAIAGDDLSEIPRLWNQQIGVIRSNPFPSSDAPEMELKDMKTLHDKECFMYGYRTGKNEHDAQVRKKERGWWMKRVECILQKTKFYDDLETALQELVQESKDLRGKP